MHMGIGGAINPSQILEFLMSQIDLSAEIRQIIKFTAEIIFLFGGGGGLGGGAYAPISLDL